MVDMNSAPASPDQAARPKKQVAMSKAKAIETAGKLFGQGKFKQAEALARQIVKNHPRLAEAYNILGVSLNALGQPKEAAATLREAIKRAPRSAVFHSNLGEVERQRRRPVEARQALLKAVELDPRQASAHNNLGILHFERGEYREAIECYSKAVAANPRFAEAYNNLGNASRYVDEPDKALGYYHKAMQHREHYPEAYNNLGSLLRDKGKMNEAEHAYRKALMQNPKYMDAHNNLASLLHANGRDAEALRILADALRVKDDHPMTLTLVSRVQLKRGNYPASEEAARRALRFHPKNADAMVALGQVLHETDRYQEAVEILQKAVQVAPNSADARNLYGVALKAVGRLDEAREQILKALGLNSRNFGAYSNLTDLLDFKETPKLVQKMEAIFAAAPNHDDPRLMPLHFGFAKALEDVGDHPRALEHYIKGTREKRRQLKYSETDMFRFFDDVKAAFPRELFEKRPFPGFATDKMIFIVGMPRSGSTLVEQILSSHPDVFGAGEIKYLARGITHMRDRFPSMARYPALVSEMESFHYELLGRSYLKNVDALAGKAKRVTDKLLTNYFFVGMLHLIFPQAKIVHTVRNPVDTCLSAYTKLFKDDMPHSYDFGEIGRYYLKYQELMDYWRSVLPADTILDVQYEDVVADVEANARKLISFVGLEWDPACVDFHKSDRPVKTASLAQVRQPVYSDSVERWRKYGPGLQPLLDALGYQPPERPKAKAKPAAGQVKEEGEAKPASERKGEAKAEPAAKKSAKAAPAKSADGGKPAAKEKPPRATASTRR